MKIIKFNSREDFGKEYYLSILQIKKYCLLQISVDRFEDYGYPYLQITSGMGRLFGVLASVWKFGLCLEILARDWSWCYDKNKSLDDLDDN